MIMSTYIFYYSYSNSCKYTFSKLWIVIRIPLVTCKMKSISTIIAKSLNIITISKLYISETYNFSSITIF